MRLAANIIPGPFGRTEAPLHDMPSKIHDMAWGEQWERHHGLVVETKSNYVMIVAATMGVSMHGGVHAWGCPCMAVSMHGSANGAEAKTAGPEGRVGTVDSDVAHKFALGSDDDGRGSSVLQPALGAQRVQAAVDGRTARMKTSMGCTSADGRLCHRC